MKRDATSTIWRTVVFAGAMLGAPACAKKKPPVAPTNTATQPETAKSTTTTTDAPKPADPNADPCAGRVRGADDDGGGGVGRGFVLS
jgi:hypothetical protein